MYIRVTPTERKINYTAFVVSAFKPSITFSYLGQILRYTSYMYT